MTISDSKRDSEDRSGHVPLHKSNFSEAVEARAAKKSRRQVILEEYNNLESNIPLNSEYWTLPEFEPLTTEEKAEIAKKNEAARIKAAEENVRISEAEAERVRNLHKEEERLRKLAEKK